MRSKYQVWELTEGSVGLAEVRNVEISEIEAAFNNAKNPKRSIYPGYYTELLIDGVLWMSDTPTEIRDHAELFSAVRRYSNGRGATVLLHGLGLGVASKGCFINGASQVTVVEINHDVIELVGYQWQKVYGDKLKIIRGDALTWVPRKGDRWDVVWHDIWPSICGDNMETMSRLHRRFGRRCGWQGSWARKTVVAHRNRKREKHRLW